MIWEASVPSYMNSKCRSLKAGITLVFKEQQQPGVKINLGICTYYELLLKFLSWFPVLLLLTPLIAPLLILCLLTLTYNLVRYKQ